MCPGRGEAWPGAVLSTQELSRFTLTLPFDCLLLQTLRDKQFSSPLTKLPHLNIHEFITLTYFEEKKKKYFFLTHFSHLELGGLSS